MNLEKPLIGGIILVGLLFLTSVYLDQQSKHSNIQSSDISNPVNSKITDGVTSEKQTSRFSKPSSAPSNQSQTSTDKDLCNALCREGILELWEKNGKLTENDIAKLINDPTQFAQLFVKNPSALADFLGTLAVDENEHGSLQTAAALIRTALSPDDKVQSGSTLLQSENNNHKIIGLDLIGNKFTSSAELSKQFSDFTLNETDSRVLTTALNHINDIDPSSPAAENIILGLDRLIHNSSSDFISGTSLIKKVELFEPSKSIRNDLRTAIESTSHKRQRYGLQALSIVIEKEYENSYDQDFSAKEFWDDQPGIVQALRAISSDPETPDKDRDAAQEILNFVPKF